MVSPARSMTCAPSGIATVAPTATMTPSRTTSRASSSVRPGATTIRACTNACTRGVFSRMPGGGAMDCGATAACAGMAEAVTASTSADADATRRETGRGRIGCISGSLLERRDDLGQHLTRVAEDERGLGIVVELVVDAGEAGVQATLDEQDVARLVGIENGHPEDRARAIVPRGRVH